MMYELGRSLAASFLPDRPDKVGRDRVDVSPAMLSKYARQKIMTQSLKEPLFIVYACLVI